MMYILKQLNINLKKIQLVGFTLLFLFSFFYNSSLALAVPPDGPTVNISYSENPADVGINTITATYSRSISSIPTISIDQPGTIDIASVIMSGSGTVFTYDYIVNADNASTYLDGASYVSLSTTTDLAGNVSSAPTNNNFIIKTIRSISDFVYTHSGLNATIIGYNGSVSDIIIPSDIDGYTINSIGNNAFEGVSLTSAIIPNSVITIGNSAFANNLLTSIIIPDSVTSIGSSAFTANNSLTSVIIGNGVTSIGASAFSYNNSLTSVTLGLGVTNIGSQAFYHTPLTSIIIPNSVISIGSQTFSETSLISVIIPESVTSIGDIAFLNNPPLTLVSFLGNAPTSMGNAVFNNASSSFKIYFKNGKTGFDGIWNGVNGTWNTYETEAIFPPISYWYNTGIDNEWSTRVGNWWTDQGHTLQALTLPTETDDVIILGINGPNVSLDNTWQAPLSIDSSDSWITFTSEDWNGLELDLTGNATFNGSSYNEGNINGNVIYNDESYNYGTVTGDVTLNDISDNAGDITGNVVFNDESYNDGTIYGDAIFNGELSYNYEDYGEINGSKTRYFSSDIITTHDFIYDGPWTIIADNAVVDISFASYNTYTTLKPLNGGSFVTESKSDWIEQTGSGQRPWGDIASSADGEKLAAVDWGGNIYTSTNSGETWTEHTIAGVPNWASITSSSDGVKLAAVSNYNEYIYTSINSGKTWTAQPLPNENNIWQSITSSSDGNKLAAVDSSNNKIYTSINSGVTWIGHSSLGLYPEDSIASSADGNNLVTSNYDGYIYTSTDSGLTWNEQIGSGQHHWQSISSSADGKKLVAGDRDFGYIYTSTNYGVTWTEQIGAGQHRWQSVTSSSDGNKLAAVVYRGGYIYISTDSGLTWIEQTSAGLRDWYSITSSSDGNKLAAVDIDGYVYTYVFPDEIVTPTEPEPTKSHIISIGTPPEVIALFLLEQEARARSVGQSIISNEPSCLQSDLFNINTGVPCPTITTSTIIPRTLKLNMTGGDVLLLQTYLNKTLNLSLLLDGQFGNKTKNAVIVLQIANNLKPDGVVGPRTILIIK